MEKYNITQTTLKIIGLYANDYEKSLHLREISRQSNTDVKAVQLQLKRLKKLNVVLSSVKGRNTEYTLNPDNILTRYYMVMAETFASIIYVKDNFLIKKIISELAGKIDGTLVLFGSFAKNAHTKESDIDLFVITDKKIKRDVILETAKLADRQISIHSSTEERFSAGLKNGDPLVNEVVSNHVVLKGTDRFCNIIWGHNAVQ